MVAFVILAGSGVWLFAAGLFCGSSGFETPHAKPDRKLDIGPKDHNTPDGHQRLKSLVLSSEGTFPVGRPETILFYAGIAAEIIRAARRAERQRHRF